MAVSILCCTFLIHKLEDPHLWLDQTLIMILLFYSPPFSQSGKSKNLSYWPKIEVQSAVAASREFTSYFPSEADGN